MLKLTASLALVASVFMLGVGAFGIYTFYGNEQWRSFLQQTEIDPADWWLHWNASNAFFIVAGLAGLISALGLWRKARWARVGWLATISVVELVYLLLFITAMAPYRFEHPTALDLALLSGIAAVSWVVLLQRSVSHQLAETHGDA